MTLLELREFFFWNMVLNMCLLLLSSIMILGARNWAFKVHSSFFKLTGTQFDTIWYTILATYKIFVFAFNIVPYIALRIMTG